MPGNDVGSPCIAYNCMSEAWDLIHDLNGGTRAMRIARERWLPKEPAEKPTDYENRLNRSFLFGKYPDTVQTLGEKPFSREIELKNADGLHESLNPIEKNADHEGTSLTVFSQQGFHHGINYGKHHILVDMPVVGDGIRLDEQRNRDIRPYFVHVKSPDLIGWKSESRPGGGGRVLTEIRIREIRVVQGGDDNYDEQETEFIRVYRLNEWILYRKVTDNKTGKGAYVEDSRGKNSLGEIPLVTFYFDLKASFMQAKPVLEDLAWMNCAHWQSSSDQRNILRVARLPLLFWKGFTSDELKKVVASAAASVKTTNKDADGKFIEHSGKAIEAGRLDIKDIEDAMDILALQPEVENVPQKTATGEIIANSKKETQLQSWVRREEYAIEECYRLAAKWVGAKLPQKFSVDIFSDFAIGGRSLQETDRILAARRDRVITQRKTLEELKRRSILSGDTDVEKEISGTSAEQGLIDTGEQFNQGGNVDNPPEN